MKLKSITLAFISAGILSQAVSADDLSELKAQLQAMQQQMQMMQSKLDAQDAALNKQQQVTNKIKHQRAPGHTGGESTARKVAHELADSLTGVVEVVANHSNSNEWSDNSSSDIVLDTFELGIDASAGDWTNAHALFLYEDADDDKLNIDEVYVTFANSEVTSFYVTAGRLYVPFGNFTSNMISDPVTLTLGETREDAVQLGFEIENGFYGSVYVFNGDIDAAKNAYSGIESNHIDNYGLNLGYVIENDDFNLDVGAGYINHIATSDTLTDVINTSCGSGACIKDYVGGLSLHAVANFAQFNLIAEYITALDDFEAGELTAINNKKLKPEAWNIEGGYNFTLAGKDTTIALGYQKTKEMYFDSETTDFFEKAWLASISVGIIDNMTLSAEWRHVDAYSKVKNKQHANGNKFDDEDLLQIKLSYEF